MMLSPASTTGVPYAGRIFRRPSLVCPQANALSPLRGHRRAPVRNGDVSSRWVWAFGFFCAATRVHGRHACQAKSQAGSVANVEAVSTLPPAALWQHFAELSSIPRASKQEAAVLEHLKSFADARGLSWKEDSVGNLVIRRPGSGGGERAEAVLLQGHVDMVCEKNAATSHDFSSDPILLRQVEGWLRATGTSLGADNGVGVAAALAVLEAGEEVSLPPIEALFTVDEETGLTGASKLDGSMVTARRMLNLDTEEFGSVYIGCAGGADSTLSIAATPAAAPDSYVELTLRVEGLLGGHSGINIHEGRGNAILLATIASCDILNITSDARLVRLEGGDKRNAIPREAEVTLALPEDAVEAAKASVVRRARAFREEYGLLEKQLTVDARIRQKVPAATTQCFSAADTTRILSAIRTLPHGPLKMSHAVEGLVETSNNVASVHTSTQGVRVVISTRSSLGDALETVRDNIQAVAHLAGGTLVREPAYPGWAPAPSSHLVDLLMRHLASVTSETPQIRAIHAGLEVGLIMERCPTVTDAVSFGPTIVGAHSPDEALEIKTVQPFFDVLMKVLADLAKPED
mmetsp:Transcript_16227/g.35507  ORF Transcript_16227/g.35507 Transcript_16227/m.35507 type:complete len:576 (+) Transcript_16227:34-1761(+)